MAEDREKGRRGDREKLLRNAFPYLPVSPFPCLLFFLALALRFPGLHWGLPNAEHWYSYHPDEFQIRNAVIALFDERNTNFNPHFFNYPSLFIYLTYFAYLLQNILGLGTPAMGSAPWPIFHDILFGGRLVCALLGAFTVPAVYSIGKRLSTEKTALFAAFLMAVAPGHVQHSHFATVDVPATFFVAWALYFAVRAMQGIEIPGSRAKAKRPLDAVDDRVSNGRLAEGSPAEGFNRRFLLFSAFLAGLAAATKYNAGLVLLAPIVALSVGNFERKAVLFFGAISLSLFGFVLGCPHSVLNTVEFLDVGGINGVYYELFVHSRQGHDNVFTDTGNGWIYHLTFNLPFAFTAPGAICAVVGLFVAARSKNKLWWPLFAFAGVYFFTLGLSQVRFMRYDFPLLPVLCLTVPLCFQPLPKAAQKFGSAILGLIMFIGATNVLYPFCVADPRDQAAAYLKSKVTKPVTVALINRPWFYTPPLWSQDYPPPSDVMSGISPDGKFRFEVVGFDVIKAEQCDYVVVNNFEYREEGRLQGKQFKFLYFLDNAPNIYSMYPYKIHPPLELIGRDFVPHDFLYSNPYVTIYQYTR